MARASSEARRQQRASVTDPDVVMEAAGALLATRPRSVADTRRRLRSRGYPAALVDRTLERLVELGLLDDGAFARSWVESRDRAHPRGTATLRRELVRQGVPDEATRSVLDERAASRPDADAQAAAHLLAKRAASLSREPDARKRRQKAYALLARSGFDPEICREVAAAYDGDAALDSEPDCP
jgi:regulatory protein